MAVLTPIFDPELSELSFGFRPGRSAHGVQRWAGEGYRVAVDLDLEKCFDQISHDVLMARVGRRVRESPSSDLHRAQSQRLLASGEDFGNTDRDDEQMA